MFCHPIRKSQPMSARAHSLVSIFHDILRQNCRIFSPKSSKKRPKNNGRQRFRLYKHLPGLAQNIPPQLLRLQSLLIPKKIYDDFVCDLEHPARSAGRSFSPVISSCWTRVSSKSQADKDNMKHLIYVELTDDEFQRLEPLDNHIASLVRTSLKSSCQPIWMSDESDGDRRILLIGYYQSSPFSFSIPSLELLKNSTSEVYSLIDHSIQRLRKHRPAAQSQLLPYQRDQIARHSELAALSA